MRFDANLSMMFQDEPFVDRFALAASLGFSAVEFWFPYHYGGKDLLSYIRSSGTRVVLFNIDPGDIQNGEWGTLGIPARKSYFRQSFDQAVELALIFHCGLINLLAGIEHEAVDQQYYMDQIRENLYWASTQVPDGIQLVMEALNPFDKPGYLLPDSEKALKLVQEINHPSVGLLYDVYHASRLESDIARFIIENPDWIRHIQIADAPGRHEPGTGSVPFDEVFSAIKNINYDGYIGLEYHPSGKVHDSLAWRRTWNI